MDEQVAQRSVQWELPCGVSSNIRIRIRFLPHSRMRSRTRPMAPTSVSAKPCLTDPDFPARLQSFHALRTGRRQAYVGAKYMNGRSLVSAGAQAVWKNMQVSSIRERPLAGGDFGGSGNDRPSGTRSHDSFCRPNLMRASRIASRFCPLLRSRSSPIPDFERAAGACLSTYRVVGRCGRPRCKIGGELGEMLDRFQRSEIKLIWWLWPCSRCSKPNVSRAGSHSQSMRSSHR